MIVDRNTHYTLYAYLPKCVDRLNFTRFVQTRKYFYGKSEGRRTYKPRRKSNKT